MKLPRRRLIACIMGLTFLVAGMSVLEFAQLYRRHTALAKLRQVGPVMHGMSSGEFQDMLRSRGSPSCRPVWKRYWDFYRPKSIASISLHGVLITDDVIELIQVFPETRRLNLTGCEITNEQLGKLVSLQELQSLRLNQSSINDAAIMHLPAFHDLYELELQGVPITDASVNYLAEVPNLAVLRIQGTSISDAGAARLTSAKNLRVLEVAAPPDQPHLITKALRDTFEREHPNCRVSLFGIYDPSPWLRMQTGRAGETK